MPDSPKADPAGVCHNLDHAVALVHDAQHYIKELEWQKLELVSALKDILNEHNISRRDLKIKAARQLLNRLGEETWTNPSIPNTPSR